ncbi:hypothetical protein DPMN_184582 [Dreissena polymorpha]|uniref:Uncharacterized protein n=1 Tax=Dreissena polymorpha TaxID=45954 RepID=A0A9D4DJ18_DREPO|nr:hypothetical protein DPMN_184582 [Dreissena polymorpha]
MLQWRKMELEKKQNTRFIATTPYFMKIKSLIAVFLFKENPEWGRQHSLLNWLLTGVIQCLSTILITRLHLRMLIH